MNNKKFKIGDRVRIIDARCIVLSELNKIGTIVNTQGSDGDELVTYVVDMGRPRRKEEPTLTCWYLQGKHIELVSKPNQQLLFNFMYEE